MPLFQHTVVNYVTTQNGDPRETRTPIDVISSNYGYYGVETQTGIGPIRF